MSTSTVDDHLPKSTLQEQITGTQKQTIITNGIMSLRLLKVIVTKYELDKHRVFLSAPFVHSPFGHFIP